MRKFFVVAPTALRLGGGTLRVAQPGEIVDYSGLPGASLIALTAEGLAKKRGGSRFKVRQRRYRARLSKTDAARLAKLEAARDNVI